MRRPIVLLILAAAHISACADDESVAPVGGSKTVKGTLDVDIRAASIDVSIEPASSSEETQVALQITKGYGLLPAGSQISGAGRVEDLPEAKSLLYTARLEAPPDPAGPCGDQPVSLGLSLHRREANAHVGGSLTAYCGKSAWSGVPARVFRLAGDLK